MDEIEAYKEPVEPWLRRWATPLSICVIPVMLGSFLAILHLLHLRFADPLSYARFTDDGDEITTEISLAGWYITIITLMIARRLYWIFRDGFKDHRDRQSALMWNTWFIGLTVVTVFIYSLDAALPALMPGRGLAFPVIAFTVARISYRVYEAILRAPEQK